MTHETVLNPTLLILHQNAKLSGEIESFCRSVHSEAQDLTASFCSADARKLASSEQDPSDFDVVVLWLSSDFIGEDSVMDWIEEWADRRSGNSGGTIYCLTGPVPTLSLRFWKVFIESIAKPNIDIYWQRGVGDGPERIAAELNRWGELYGETGGESEKPEFTLQSLA